MGSDIEAIIEIRNDAGWCKIADFDIERDYVVFAVLGNVRNRYRVPCIGENRIQDNMPSELMPNGAFMTRYASHIDAYGASYVTLAEMREYDLGYSYYHNGIVERDAAGRITMLRYVDDPSLPGERRGMVRIFEEWPGGREQWQDYIESIAAIALTHGESDPGKIRLVFFFYN